MAGFTSYEGLNYFGNVLVKAGTQEDLYMGLFTNAGLPSTPLDETAVWADITQPTGSGYAEIALTTGNFVVSSQGVITYPQQEWTATASDWSSDTIWGYYVRNDNATPKVIFIQYRDGGAFQMTEGRVYTVDLSIDTSGIL